MALLRVVILSFSMVRVRRISSSRLSSSAFRSRASCCMSACGVTGGAGMLFPLPDSVMVMGSAQLSAAGGVTAKPASAGGSEGVRRNLYQMATRMMRAQPAQTGRLYPIYWRFRKDLPDAGAVVSPKLPGSSCSFFMDNFPVVCRSVAAFHSVYGGPPPGSCQRPGALPPPG
ncbi:Uncharacterised protein [Shigella sonnei]|nr:Uncharacterised protein [Shigella sonnei]